MSRTFLMATVAVAPLLMACPDRYEPDGWYGAIDAGDHYVGDLKRRESPQ